MNIEQFDKQLIPEVVYNRELAKYINNGVIQKRIEELMNYWLKQTTNKIKREDFQRFIDAFDGLGEEVKYDFIDDISFDVYERVYDRIEDDGMIEESLINYTNTVINKELFSGNHYELFIKEVLQQFLVTIYNTYVDYLYAYTTLFESVRYNSSNSWKMEITLKNSNKELAFEMTPTGIIDYFHKGVARNNILSSRRKMYSFLMLGVGLGVEPLNNIQLLTLENNDEWEDEGTVEEFSHSVIQHANDFFENFLDYVQWILVKGQEFES